MKVPSLLSCIYSLLNSGGSPALGISDLPVPPAAEEIQPSEDSHAKLFSTEPVSLPGGILLLKGRLSNAELCSDAVPGVYEGLKLSECAIDLVDTLRREIQDGQLSFRGKRVLEVGCGHGLPGIFACIKGAGVAHFHDLNAEVVRRLTIPNVMTNLEYARQRMTKHNGGSLTPTRQQAINPEVHFYSGDWADAHNVLSQLSNNNDMSGEFNFNCELSSHPSTPPPYGGDNSRPSTPFTEREREFSSRPSTPPTPREFSSRPSTPGGDQENDFFQGRSRRRSSGSRAFERSRDRSSNEGGYDIILMSDTVYSAYSLPKLYELIKKCLRPYYGVMYVAARKHYLGRGGGSRQFKNMVEDDGMLGAHLVADFPDGFSSTREVWKFFFR